VSGVVTPLSMTRELLVWISSKPRAYDEVVETWVSNCPRHPVWDDAVTAGLVRVSNGSVRLTSRGRATLAAEGAA
jgi:hypothetical protein